MDSGTLIMDIGSSSGVYPVGSTGFQHISNGLNSYRLQPKSLDNMDITLLNEIQSPYEEPSKLNEILHSTAIEGTSAAEFMKRNARIAIHSKDVFEYDIAIPLPPPNRRYKVKLNIKSIRKTEPTTVEPDWI